MDDGPTRVRDRTTGTIFEERVFGGSYLDFLYNTRRGQLLTRGVVARSWFSAVYGWLQRSPRSRSRIPRFVKGLAIDASEAEKPLSEYESLDAFFTRRLKPSARPIDLEPTHLLSPSDGRVLVVPELEGRTLRIKGSEVELDELLGDPELASDHRDGAAMIVRLAPADYHWFHFPASGEASASRAFPGLLHSVHAIALNAGAPSFVNKRSVSTLDTEGFGKLVIVEVGAMLVGTILQTYEPGPVERGQAKGYFRFGGSTVVVIARNGALSFDDDLVEDSANGLETLVRMGTRVGVVA